jgi:hypothetical protein
MTTDEQGRFDLLRQGPCVPPEYVEEFYGLPWPFQDDLLRDFENWSSRIRKRTHCPEGLVSRYELESFMGQARMVSRKWMAARLGMSTESLQDVLSRLQLLGMRPQRYIVYPELISDTLAEDIIPVLPGLRFRTFSDQNSFCSRLHADLRESLKIEIHPLFCTTSVRLQEYPRQFSSHFDCITLEPLSVKHQLWLDFRKPLNLGPDRTSKLFYAENREQLKPYCAGSQEPEDLEIYEGFLAAQGNA